MNAYTHKVQYYETDKMGVTHHSNYIRWMEEARTDYMEQMGYSYQKLETLGVMSPVVGIECSYKASTTYADIITVKVEIEELTGVKLKVKYTMTKEDGTLAFEGISTHCFLGEGGKIVRLKNEVPELYEAFKNSMDK